VNPEFPKVWQFIQSATPEQIEDLKRRKWSATRNGFFHVRDHFKPKSLVDQIWKALYIARHSFRKNRRSWRGEWVDGAPTKPPAWLDRIAKYKAQLANVRVENRDWKEIVRKYDSPTAFFYFDPPYEENFAHELAHILPTIKGHWLLSFSDDANLKRALDATGAETYRVKVNNLLHGGASPVRNEQRGELLAANYSIDVPEDLTFKSVAHKAKRRPNQPDNAPVAPLAKPRENLDPTGGASTSQAPRLKPTPTIPRPGTTYPQDVPPVEMATAPSGAKFILQDKRGAPPPFKKSESTDTGSLGPDHRETLGFTERDLSKVHDDVQRSMWARKARKQVNAYDARQEWKGGRLETHLIPAPKKSDIQKRRKMQLANKTVIDPEHGHPPVFQGSVAAERGLARKLTDIMKAFRAGNMSRENALREAVKAIDENQARITEIARKRASRVIGKEISELAPEVSQRLEQIRTQAIGDFENILKDATTN
jgi:hypothetical protein